jgi:hypothetical protein
MSHLKRLLWLAAWSAWLLAGVGLHRELPRDLGPAVCTLPLEADEYFWGFIGDGGRLVTWKKVDEGRPAPLRVWNAATGSTIHRLDGPVETAIGWNYVLYAADGLILARRRPPVDGRDAEGPSTLDLLTGRWIDLPPDHDMKQVVSHARPWAAFYGRVNENEPTCVHVFDLRTGSRIFVWEDRTRHGSPHVLYDRPVFVMDDRLAIPVRRPVRPGEDADERLEVWSILDGVRVNEFHGVRLGADPIGSSLGRIAWRVETDPFGGADVFDLREGRIVLAYPPGRQQLASGRWDDFGPILSAKGRTLFRTGLNKLVDIDTGAELWSVRPETTWGPFTRFDVVAAVDSAGDLVVYEEVQTSLTGGRKVGAFSVRSPADGRFKYRYWASSINERNKIAPDGRRVFNTETRSIHQWPPRVNWPLLALCQAILALPLVLLWTLLRWRRKRRLRLAGPTP